jgi:hypothetical protein
MFEATRNGLDVNPSSVWLRETTVTQLPASRLKRTFLLTFFALLCWLAYSNILHTKSKPKIIHASRSVFMSLFNAS